MLAFFCLDVFGARAAYYLYLFILDQLQSLFMSAKMQDIGKAVKNGIDIFLPCLYAWDASYHLGWRKQT
jgi:hypothetical protein